VPTRKSTEKLTFLVFRLAYSVVFRAGEDEVKLDIARKTFKIPLKTFSLSRVRASALTRVLSTAVLLFKASARLAKTYLPELKLLDP
jgi:hypothetical protein